LAAFLKELEDLDSMSGPDIMAAMADLPVPQEGSVDGMSFQDAVEVGKTHVMKSYMISNMISLQAKLLPAHNMEDGRAFTRSERILLDHQKLKRMSAVDLRDLIRDVLHNPEFNASEVDHNMHERLMRAVEEGEMDILDMWQDGDGEQDVRFFNADGWTVGELNAILDNNLVPGTRGHLRTFGCIQWESELFNGRPKARCYPFDLPGHRFRGKNPQVCT
jgi:hypothetical protein